MQVYNAREVMDCYNRTATEYAEQFIHELENKPYPYRGYEHASKRAYILLKKVAAPGDNAA